MKAKAKPKKKPVTGVVSSRRVAKPKGVKAHGMMMVEETYKKKRAGFPKKGTTVTKNTVAKRAAMQTGKTQSASGLASDAKRPARLPGTRVSKKGETYTETRRNRSDARQVTRKSRGAML